MKNKNKQKGRKRENQCEGCRRYLRQFLASLLFRLLPPPSTPSPAAHHFARLCQRSGRGTGGHLVRFWAMSSPHLTTTSPATRSHRAAPRRSAILPAILPASSPLPGGEGMCRTPARAGDPLPLILPTLSTLSGCRPHIPYGSRQRGGGLSAYLGRRGSSVRFKVSGIFARLYRSKIQLFNFSEGFIRAKPVHRGNGNCT